MLSTMHDHSMVHRPDRKYQNQHQTKPTCIADYNKYMGGVDLTDQLLKPYEIPRKTLKWYKKLAIHFMRLSMLNSYIVYQKGRKPFLGFQCEVLAALMFETGADMKIARKEHVIRLTKCHFFWKQPLNKSLRRDTGCAPTRKEFAKTVCPSNPGLCYYSCFELYHTKVNYWV